MRVPRYNSQQVESTNLRGNYSDGGISARTFGADIAQGLANVGGVVHDIYQEQQQKADDAALLSFDNAMSGIETDLLHNPETGAYTRQGSEAFDLEQKVMPHWDTRQAEAVNALPGRLRARAMELAQRRRNDAQRGIMRHTMQQADAYGKMQAESSIANATNTAILNYRDDERIGEELARAGAALDIQLRGAPPETAAMAHAELNSGIFAGVIDRHLQDDPVAGEAALEKYAKYLTAKDRMALDKQILPLAVAREDQAELQHLLGGIGPAVPAFTGEATQHKAGTGLATMPLATRRTLKYDAPELNAYAAYVEQEHNLPVGIINALKNAGEKSNSGQVSPAGARGVMQFMPQNLRKYGVTDPTDPLQMIEAAGKYLRDTSRQYGGNVAAMIADYNGGPRQATRVLNGQVPAAEETRKYLARVSAALGGVESGQSQTVAVDAPQNEVETLRMIDAAYANNPAKQERLRRLASREWGMRNAERAERERGIHESVYKKIYAADPRASLDSLLTRAEREQLIRDGNYDVFESELTRRATDTKKQSDPLLVEALEREAILSPDTFAKRDIYKVVDKLDNADLSRLLAHQAELNDPTKAEGAKARWATDDQLLSMEFDKLGIANDPATKGVNEESIARGEYKQAFYLQREAFAKVHKRQPTADESAAMLRSLTLSRARGRGAYGAQAVADRPLFERLTALENPEFAVPEDFRPAIIASLRAAGVANPTELQIRQTWANQVAAKTPGATAGGAR